MRRKRKTEKNKISLSLMLIVLLLVSNCLGGSLANGTPYLYAMETESETEFSEMESEENLSTEAESETASVEEDTSEESTEENTDEAKAGEVLGYYSNDAAAVTMLSNAVGSLGEVVYRYAFLTDSEEMAEIVSNKLGAELVSFNAGVAEIETDYVIPENTIVEGIEIFENYEYEIDLFEVETEENVAESGTEYSLQYHIGFLNLEEAWNISKGKGVKVATIDSGVNYNHPALAGNIAKATYSIPDEMYEDGTLYDTGKAKRALDNHGHGTHVAGIIAATEGNSVGIVGVAPKAKIISIKSVEYNAAKSKTRGLSAWTAAAVNIAVSSGANVINMSLGGLTKKDELIEEALKKATKKGIIVVCAAGNSSPFTPISYPGFSEYTYAVTAGTKSGDSLEFASSYSKYGEGVDFIAPGSSIISANYLGGYSSKSGTSMACPIVSGIFALMKAEAPSVGRTKLYEILKETALDLGDTGYDTKYGYGMPRPLEALELLKERYPNAKPTPTPVPTPEPEPETNNSSDVESDAEETGTVISANASAAYGSAQANGQMMANMTAIPNNSTVAKASNNKNKTTNNKTKSNGQGNFEEITLEGTEGGNDKSTSISGQSDDTNGAANADGVSSSKNSSADSSVTDAATGEKSDEYSAGDGQKDENTSDGSVLAAFRKATKAITEEVSSEPIVLLPLAVIIFLIILFIILKKRKDDKEKEG